MKHDSGLDGALNIITQLIKLSKMTLCMCNSQKKAPRRYSLSFIIYDSLSLCLYPL